MTVLASACILNAPDHVWCYDFAKDTTDDGRPSRMVNLIAEYTRERLAVRVG